MKLHLSLTAILLLLIPCATLAQECDCWIQPDDSYTQITTDMWTVSGGGGPAVDSSFGPVDLGGGNTFDLFGTSYSNFYINTDGSVSFGAEVIDWTPEPFPQSAYAMIAGLWADVDLRYHGEVWYKVGEEAVFVNFINVTHYNSIEMDEDPPANTFQIAFAFDGFSIDDEGNNVRICFQQLEWAHGDVGAINGFQGPNPATSGVNAGDGVNGAHIGRFNLPNMDYNGPDGDEDGLFWLNNRSFNFDTRSNTENLAPVVAFNAPCDVVTLCMGQEYIFDLDVFSTDPDQTFEFAVVSSISGFEEVSSTAGNHATFDAVLTANEDILGENSVFISATDNADPPNETIYEFVFETLEDVSPELSISGDLTLCPGDNDGVVLTASPDFAEYLWGVEGCDGQTCTVTEPGTLQIQFVTDLGCMVNETLEIGTHEISVPTVNNPSLICAGDTAMVTVDEAEIDTYTAFEWEVNDFGDGGIIYGESNEASAEVGPGFYSLIATDLNGCEASSAFIIQEGQPIEWEVVTTPEEGGTSNGTVDIMFIAGSPVFEFDWGSLACDSNPCDGLPAGDYEVDVVDAAGCTASIAFTIGVISNLEEYAAGAVLLYPNPSTDYLYIQDFELGSHYQILDASGRVVASGSITESRVDVENLKKGVYYFALKSQVNGVPVQGRFLKE